MEYKIEKISEELSSEIIKVDLAFGDAINEWYNLTKALFKECYPDYPTGGYRILDNDDNVIIR